MGVTQEVDAVEFHQWNRKILSSYWIIILLITIAECTTAVYEYGHGDDLIAPLLRMCIIPSCIMAACMAGSEIANYYKHHSQHYAFMLTGTAISIVLVITFPHIHGIQLSFLPSIFGSVSYYSRRKLLFSFVVNMFSFLALYGLLSDLRHNISPSEFIITIAFFCNCSFIVFGVKNRGIKLHQNLISIMKDQRDLMMQNIMMEKMSKTDALTDLYNHKTFHEYLDKLVEQSETSGMPLQLAMIDIDNFKSVNDTYGHWVGDVIIRRVANIIKSLINSDDFPARYGGEEFAVIVTDKSMETAYEMMENIRMAVSHVEHEELGGKSVTISVGIQSYKPGEGKERLFKGADYCLYSSKRTGKNKTLYNLSFGSELTNAITNRK